jgi:hypothetical protein
MRFVHNGPSTVAFLLATALIPAQSTEPPLSDSKSNKQRLQPSVANPFGISIGMTTCSLAQAFLSSQVIAPTSSEEQQEVVVTVRDPERLYPKATDIEAICNEIDSAVHTLNVGVADDTENSGAREAFKVLAGKYRRVEGSPIPTKGNGYARFAASGAAIELKVWGNGKDFLIIYTDSQLFERLKKFREVRRKNL